MSDTMCWALRKGVPNVLELFDGGEPGKSLTDLRRQLDSLSASDRLLVWINSACGSFERGLAIYRILDDCRAWTRILIQFAAGGAAVAAMSRAWPDRFICPDGSFWVHAPNVDCIGNPATLVEGLADLTYDVATVFAVNIDGGGDLEPWRTRMEEGHYWAGEDGVKRGIARAISTLAEQSKAWKPWVAAPQAHSIKQQLAPAT